MKSKCCNLNNNDLASNEIDFEHKIESVINDCKVTIYFSKNRNNMLKGIFSKIFWIHLRTE